MPISNPIIHHSIRIHGRRKNKTPPLAEKIMLENLHVSIWLLLDPEKFLFELGFTGILR
jgi:hypothetical protein